MLESDQSTSLMNFATSDSQRKFSENAPYINTVVSLRTKKSGRWKVGEAEVDKTFDEASLEEFEMQRANPYRPNPLKDRADTTVHERQSFKHLTCQSV